MSNLFDSPFFILNIVQLGELDHNRLALSWLHSAMQAPALRSLMCYIGVTYFNKPNRDLAIAMEPPVHLLPLNYNNVTEQRQK